MAETLKPDTAAQVKEAIAWALAEEKTLELRGGGSKQSLGRPSQTAHQLDLSALTGIVNYEPEELVLTAAAGTSLKDIESLLAQNGQALTFEPPNFGTLLGAPEALQTIGGVLACNLAGPRRLKAGAARDHFLGVEAVSGRGEVFKSGGRVVKNVTGYDLCKLLAGSHGTLAAMTEVSVKVLPKPEKTRTVLVFGLEDASAARAMAEALQSPHEVASAAHLPTAMAARSAVSYAKEAGTSVTALRVEGPGPSAVHRCAALKDQFADRGEIEELHGRNSEILWREIRDVAAFHGDSDDGVLWRLSVPPLAGPEAVAEIGKSGPVSAYYDWAGGLVWLTLDDEREDGGTDVVRRAVARTGGHATLWRAPVAVRAAVPVFQPQPTPLADLTRRVKAGFDPRGVLNPGRMYAGV